MHLGSHHLPGRRVRAGRPPAPHPSHQRPALPRPLALCPTPAALPFPSSLLCPPEGLSSPTPWAGPPSLACSGTLCLRPTASAAPHRPGSTDSRSALLGHRARIRPGLCANPRAQGGNPGWRSPGRWANSELALPRVSDAPEGEAGPGGAGPASGDQAPAPEQGPLLMEQR